MIKRCFNASISWIYLLVFVVLVSCNKDNNSTARLEVRLTDAPGDYQEVNIDIQDVQVNSHDGSDSTGWRSLVINKGVYDLLTLTTGLDTLLGEVTLPVGKLSQLRLVLGTNNSIKVSGQVHPLNTPSAQQSGLKIQIHTDLKEGITYKILLDFSAAESIVATGSNEFILKPVIRSIVESESGAVKGVVSPTESRPAVYAVLTMDTVATTFADSTSGKFLLQGLAAGTYIIRFAPKTGYLPTARESVAVTLGNVTDLDTVAISQ